MTSARAVPAAAATIRSAAAKNRSLGTGLLIVDSPCEKQLLVVPF
jgi:hypothetical protein